MTKLKNKFNISLPIQLLIALVLGAVFGSLIKSGAGIYNFLGTAFIDLITMIILPLIFPVVVVSVASIIKQQSFGKLFAKSFIYFFAVTTLIFLLFTFGGYFINFGGGAGIHQGTSNLSGIAQHVNLNSFLLSLIPQNIIKSFAAGSLLPVVIFAIFLGFGIGSLKEDQAQPLLRGFQAWVDAIYVVTNLIIRLLPIGIFGFVANDVATIGFNKLIGLGKFVVGVYVGYVILAIVIYPIIARIFGVPYFKIVRDIWDLLVFAFISGSSSVVLPQLLQRLKDRGSSTEVTDFVVPLGYTFNLDGAAVYLSLATVFVANAYHINLTITSLLFTVVLLTLVGKTIATIPSGAIVVLLATAVQLGLPKEGIALIFTIDFFVNAGRTALNVLGNSLAVHVLEKQPVKEPERNLKFAQE